MLSVSEAQQRLLTFFSPLDSEEIPVLEAAGRVNYKPVISPLSLPPFPNSAMDGFAVRAVDVATASAKKPVTLRVVGDIAAGVTPQGNIQPGQAMRIMTGAQVPGGADAIVPVESTNFFTRQAGLIAPEQVDIYRPAEPGDHVRRKGEDVQSGAEVIPAGRKLRPQEIGFLSLLGIEQVTVYRKPRVAVLSSGDELLSPGEPLAPGKIYDANSRLLSALVARAGAIPVNLGIARDSEEDTQACLDRAVSQQADFIVSSAGVSVGAFDYVRTVIERNGKLDFWRVKIRPGRPIAFGHYRQTPFFGLPGNPVSAYIGFEVFVRPAICWMTGLIFERRTVRARLMQPIESDGRESYLRATVSYSDGWEARLTGHQGSGNLHSLVQANALLIIPSEVKSLPSGAELEAWLMED